MKLCFRIWQQHSKWRNEETRLRCRDLSNRHTYYHRSSWRTSSHWIAHQSKGDSISLRSAYIIGQSSFASSVICKLLIILRFLLVSLWPSKVAFRSVIKDINKKNISGKERDILLLFQRMSIAAHSFALLFCLRWAGSLVIPSIFW